MSLISTRSLESGLKGKSIILVGTGNVGSAVAKSIMQLGVGNKVHSVVDSKGSLILPNSGKRDLFLEDVNRIKANNRFEYGTLVSDMVEDIKHLGLSPIIIDISTNDDSEMHYNLAQQGLTIITANKVPAAMLEAEKAFELIQKINYGYDATVMAGQGAIARLKETKEEVDDGLLKLLSIECICSGTLARITKEVAKGVPFSEAVIMVMELGFTESDPMNDLDGMDVAKKLVIIARTLGYAVNIEDVEVEGVLDNSFRKIFLEVKTQVEIEFTGQNDEVIKKEIRERFALSIKKAGVDEQYVKLLLENKGKVPRFVASITFIDGEPKLKTGIKFLSVDSDDDIEKRTAIELIAAESNKIVVNIDRGGKERNNHFIIGGNGAGPFETASGVLRDLVRVLRR